MTKLSPNSSKQDNRLRSLVDMVKRKNVHQPPNQTLEPVTSALFFREFFLPSPSNLNQVSLM
jgi:hypothetical protein